MTSTEVHTKPMSTMSFTVGKDELDLKPGIITTIDAIAKLGRSLIIRVGRNLGAKTSALAINLRLVQCYAQLKWYEAHGVTPPEVTQHHLTRTLQEAQTMSDGTETGDAPATAVEPKARRGTRPYCRQLIDAGETNEDTLLAKVHEQFPDKVAQFGKADVRGQLRQAGKLDWTGRKGKKATKTTDAAPAE